MFRFTALNSDLNYSTSESICGKWIDGSDIYRKCYHFESLPLGTTTIDTGFTYTPTKFYGIGKDRNGSWIPIPNTFGSSSNGTITMIMLTHLWISAGNIVIHLVDTGSFNPAMTNVTIVLEYIKK